MIYFAVDELRVGLLNGYLAGEWGSPLRDCIRQMTYTDLFRARSLPRGAWIFCALDALSDAELRMVHHLQCAARDAGLQVYNSAREALHRYQLLQLLHQTGSNDFRAHRAAGPLDTVRFPVFVRVADEHDGSLTPLLHDRSALRRAMAYLWMRGLARHQLLVVEFCETAGADGLYRKYSVLRIGDSYVPRHLLIGREWMTKDEGRDAEERLILEETNFLRENPHAAWARSVFEMAHIEYGRLDYGVREGRPQAWEINFTPVFGRGDVNRPADTPGKQRMRRLTHSNREFTHAAIREAFRRIEPGPLPGNDVAFEFPPSLVEESRRERRNIRSLAQRQQGIARIAAAPGVRAIGPLLRRTFRG